VNLEFSEEQDALADMVAGIASDAREKGWFARSAGQDQSPRGDIVAQLASADLLRLGLAEPLGVGGGWTERAIVAEQLGRSGYRGRYFDAQAAVLAFSRLAAAGPDDSGWPAADTKAATAGQRFMAAPGLHNSTAGAQHGMLGQRVSGVEGAPLATHVMWLRRAGSEPELMIAAVQPGGVQVTEQESVDGDSVGAVDLPASTDLRPVLAGPQAESFWSETRLAMAVLRAAEMVGACGIIVERTVAHAMGRTVFGRPIAAFQAAQHDLAKAEILRRSARLLVYRAASQFEAESPARERSGDMALLLACDALLECVRVASQINGGTGFIVDHWLPDYFARAKALDLRTGGRPCRLRHVRDSVLSARKAGLRMQDFWQWGIQ
jgi:alkylation response protein AidB-like acyl-CoA dehydrogenase